MNYLFHCFYRTKLDEFIADKLRRILLEVIELLSVSQDSDWSDMDVSETLKVIHKQLIFIDNRRVQKSKLYYLFLPTGPLQEISMQNGWSDEYLLIAERFDGCIRM